MTTPTSLFATPAPDFTLERVRGLVQSTPTETLTVEYKREFAHSLVESVAAMANTYGGLILVGVTNEALDDRLVGVSGEVAVQIANACHDTLEPPWVPELIALPLSDAPDALNILVLRVDPVRSPRPLLIKGCAPIRLPGRNAKADRSRLRELFTDASSSPRATTGSYIGQRGLPPPVQVGGWPEPIPTDFMIRSGLVLAVAEHRSWRPLADGRVDALAAALDNSPAGAQLRMWSGVLGATGFSLFHREGFNRARHARLVSGAVGGSQEVPHPIEAIAEINLPDRYGSPNSNLTFTLDFIVQARLAYAAAQFPAPFGWRLGVSQLFGILDSFLCSLTDDVIVQLLAELAGVDGEIVGQPTMLYFATGPLVGDLLDLHGLAPIPDAGFSGGANLYSDPSLDLRDPKERRQQAVTWLEQIALDAGLRGMERVIAEFLPGLATES
jgi:hypothetical protein